MRGIAIFVLVKALIVGEVQSRFVTVSFLHAIIWVDINFWYFRMVNNKFKISFQQPEPLV